MTCCEEDKLGKEGLRSGLNPLGYRELGSREGAGVPNIVFREAFLLVNNEKTFLVGVGGKMGISAKNGSGEESLRSNPSRWQTDSTTA
jgi:hypothetical protein